MNSMIRDFKCEVAEGSDKIAIIMSGAIDERAAFPKIESLNKTVTIDMNGVRYMTSYGVRLWTDWINAQKSAQKIVLDRVPSVIVKQFNMFHGFLSEQSFINSLYAPYYCPATTQEKDVLLIYGTHFSEERLTIPEQIESDGQILEPDFSPEAFFGFLHR